MTSLAYIHELAEELLPHLPGKWTLKPCNPAGGYCSPWSHRADLDGPGEITLGLSYDSHQGRVTIKPLLGELALHRPPTVKAMRITVGAVRGVEAIAREIVRRLLPDAEEMIRKCRDQKQRDDSEETRMDTLATSIAQHIRGDVHKNSPFIGDRKITFGYRRMAASGAIRASPTNDRIRFELDIDEETAVQLAEFLGVCNRIPARDSSGNPAPIPA